MITYYLTNSSGETEVVEKIQKGCWISVQQPTLEEMNLLIDLGINRRLIENAIDEKEKSHIEVQSDQSLLIFDIPLTLPYTGEDKLEFHTLPVGFIFNDDYIISITSFNITNSEELSDLAHNKMDTRRKKHLMLSMVYYISSRFTMHLDNIDGFTNDVDARLRDKVSNDDLIKILGLQKSLVYFTNALNSTKATLEKLDRNRNILLTEEEEDILSDIHIEIEQSLHTAAIYTEVLESMVDAISSIVSNNMNIIMKLLTTITLVMSIPTMIFGFYGMNVTFARGEISFWVPLVVTLAIAVPITWLFYKSNLF